MIASNLSIPDTQPETLVVEDVLAEVRVHKPECPEAVYLEERKLQRALRRRGCYSDLGKVECARGWLVMDVLGITA